MSRSFYIFTGVWRGCTTKCWLDLLVYILIDHLSQTYLLFSCLFGCLLASTLVPVVKFFHNSQTYEFWLEPKCIVLCVETSPNKALYVFAPRWDLLLIMILYLRMVTYLWGFTSTNPSTHLATIYGEFSACVNETVGYLMSVNIYFYYC